jgi:hypothetical protein
MKDEDKTKEQLIAELVELRQSNAELESKTRRLTSELAGLRRRIAELGDHEQHLKTGEILVKMGYATEQQLEEALEKQEELSKLEQRQKLLTIMVDSGTITEEQLRTVLAVQSARIAIR